jgi:hypothetical protein
VSTPVADVVRPFGELGLVEIASGAEQFVAKAEQLLGRPKLAWLHKVDAHLATMSWDLIWGRMELLMQRTLNARLPAGVSEGAEEVIPCLTG